ncbi:MAG: PAS domain S-box protein, partial [Candidatus Competibacter sp.]|nr:PAS domain S-box protein [Candidatus Competibacter sp.]
EAEPDAGLASSPPLEAPTAARVGFRPWLAWPFLLLVAAIFVLTLGAIAYTSRQQWVEEVARLQTVADLKTGHLAAWFGEREGDAQLVSGSRHAADLYRRWRDAGDASSRDPLREYLRQYQSAYGYESLWVLDERGEVVLATGDAPPAIAPPLRAAIRRAIAEGRVSNTGLYRDGDRPSSLHLDFVAPLSLPEGRPGPVVVLRTDVEAVLGPLLRFWPLPDSSAETLLFGRDGDPAYFSSERNPRPAATAPPPRPDERQPDPLVARVLRSEAKPGEVVEGIDDRRAPVVGVASAIPGTDWFLLVKLDRAEVDAPAWRNAIWIALTGVMILAFAVLATFVAHQREAQVLRDSLLQGQRQTELRTFRQLASERGRLRTLIDTIPDLIWLKDPDGVYLACNPPFERFFGAREADILGKTDHDFVAAELADFFWQKDREALAAGRPSVNEEWITFAEGGRRVLLETIKTPMRDAGGTVLGVLGIGRDITARRAAEAQVRKLSLAVAQSPASIVITDLEARIEYANAAFVTVSGYRLEEILGQNSRVLQSGKTPAATYAELWDRLTRGEMWQGEFVNRRKSGEEYIEFARITPIRQSDGRITHYLAIKEDITERKRTAAELDRYHHHLEELVAERTEQLTEARERAEAANRAKSAFLANMSH